MKTPLFIIFFLDTKMESIKKDIIEDKHSTLWRTVFLALVFGALTLVVALSIFFYIRTREPMWDNRSGISRLVVTNRSSPERFGTEVFTMFGSEEITLNGEPINDESTMYIADGGILVLEMAGVSRDTSTGDLSTYASKLLVSRKDGNSLTPMDLTGTNLSATEIEITPVTGDPAPIMISLSGTRVEVRGTSGRKYALKFQVTGWYP
jgi:hypothetical protein